MAISQPPCQQVVAIILLLSLTWTSGEVPARHGRGRINAFFQNSCASTKAPGPCEQVCTDFKNGGFYCQCYEGYTINKDGMTCTQDQPMKPGGQLPSHTIPSGRASMAAGLLDIEEEHGEEFRPHTRLVNKVDPNDPGTRVKALPRQGGLHTQEGHGPVEVQSFDLRQGVKPPEAAHLRRPWEGGYDIHEGGAQTDNTVDIIDLVEGGDEEEDPDPYAANTVGNMPPVEAGSVAREDLRPGEAEPSCDGVDCQNNGTCVATATSATCQCPLGSYGTFCEKVSDVRYPKFDGNGYLALPVMRNAHKEFAVSLEFRPDSGYGLVLFSGELSTARSDFFSVSLDGGVVVYRFDCGTGLAEVRSSNRVTLGAWNQILITRVDNRGSLQLNGDVPAQGKAKGDYTRITFRLNLYVGGFPDVAAISPRVATDTSFVGCVQHLLINGHQYDFRQMGLVGEAEHGINVGDCTEGICEGVTCHNGGTCGPKSADQPVCLCPIGFHGDSCEKDSAVHVPHFSGHSYMEFPGLARSALSFTEVEMVFKPTSREGAILYNGFSRDRKGDFISLAMRDGHLEFSFDLGTGPAVIRSVQPLTPNQWHLVHAARTNTMGTLDIDGHPQATGQSQGGYTQLTLLEGLYLGGHPNFDHTSKHANLTRSFTGCLQKVVINKHTLPLTEAEKGVNIGPCSHPCAGQPCLNGGECKPVREMYTCYCPLGFTNSNCEEAQESLPTKPMFNGESYLTYSDKEIVQRVEGDKMDLVLQLRPRTKDGLLFWSGEDLSLRPGGDFFSLALYQGSLQVRYNLGSGEGQLALNFSQLYDGYWHRVRVQRDKQLTYIEVDEQVLNEGSSPGTYTSLNTDKLVHLGGLPDIAVKTGGRFTQGYAGCIKTMRLATDYDVDLLEQVDTGRNIMQCRKKFFT